MFDPTAPFFWYPPGPSNLMEVFCDPLERVIAQGRRQLVADPSLELGSCIDYLCWIWSWPDLPTNYAQFCKITSMWHLRSATGNGQPTWGKHLVLLVPLQSIWAAKHQCLLDACSDFGLAFFHVIYYNIISLSYSCIAVIEAIRNNPSHEVVKCCGLEIASCETAGGKWL